MMNRDNICQFNQKPDASRLKLLKMLGIKDLSEQPTSQIQIKYPNKCCEEITIISFEKNEEGYFVGAFFEHINMICDDKENDWFVFSWAMANEAWMCFGEESAKVLPSEIILMFNRIKSHEEVLVKVVHE